MTDDDPDAQDRELQEFRDDVVRVARDRGEGVTIEQVAKDFGVHPMTLHKPSRDFIRESML